MGKVTMTVREAAELLGMSPQGVRVNLQKGILPIGYAIPSTTGNGWRYLIFKDKMEKFIGAKDGLESEEVE